MWKRGKGGESMQGKEWGERGRGQSVGEMKDNLRRRASRITVRRVAGRRRSRIALRGETVPQIMDSTRLERMASVRRMPSRGGREEKGGENVHVQRDILLC